MQTSFIQSRYANCIGKSGDGARHVLLVHGLAEHMGRYGHVVEALTGAGFAVTAVELRGHGESEGKRGARRPLGAVLGRCPSGSRDH